MSETIGDVLRRTFGLYDYVVLRGKEDSVTYAWDAVPDSQEGRKFTEYSIKDGMTLSKEFEVPSDGMADAYLVFEV